MNRIITDLFNSKKIFFILRGYPGLGRIMQGFSLSKIIQDYNPSCIQHFFSSDIGYKFLKENGIPVNNLQNSVDGENWFYPFSNKNYRKLLSLTKHEKPDFIIVDGELSLIPSLHSLIGTRIVAISNICDLINYKQPEVSFSMRTFYCYADQVIVGSFSNEVISDLSPIDEDKLMIINPIIRPSILNMAVQKEENIISIVLGGGSINDSFLEDQSKRFIQLIVDISFEFSPYRFEVFGLSKSLDITLPTNVIINKSYNECIDTINHSVVTICRSGRNLISEMLYLNKKCILLYPMNNGYRQNEQIANIEFALKYSKNIMCLKKYNREHLINTIYKSINSEKVIRNWNPGNTYFKEIYAN